MKEHTVLTGYTLKKDSYSFTHLILTLIFQPTKFPIRINLQDKRVLSCKNPNERVITLSDELH